MSSRPSAAQSRDPAFGLHVPTPKGRKRDGAPALVRGPEENSWVPGLPVVARDDSCARSHLAKPLGRSHCPLGHERGGAVDEIRITNGEELEAWLQGKPREWAIAIAARAALRVVPQWAVYLEPKVFRKQAAADSFILALFRCVAVSRLSASMSNRDLRAAARSAASASAAADAADTSAYAASAAADAAAFTYASYAASTYASYASYAAADAADTAARSAASASAASAASAADASARSAASADASYASVAASAVWAAVSADATVLAGGLPGAMTGPLWRRVELGADGAVSVVDVAVPVWADTLLGALPFELLARGAHWSIWLDWYDAVLNNKPPWGLPRDVCNEVMYQLLTLDESEWKKGPGWINGRLAQMVTDAQEAERQKTEAASTFDIFDGPLEPELPALPKPETGPQVGFKNNLLSLQHQPRTDAADDIAAQKKLHGRLQRLLPTLAAETNKVGNIHPGLALIIGEYAELINPDYEQLEDFDIWAVGAGLIASAAAFAKPGVSPQLTPALEPSHLVLLSQAAQIHSAFILGQPAGRIMIDRADEMALTDEQFALIGQGMMSILGLWQHKTDGVEEATRRFIGSVREAMVVSGWKAGRTGFVGYSLTRNGLITIGRKLSFINSAGSTIVGGVVMNEVDPGLVQTQIWLRFMSQNSQQILQFVAPFPEMRAWFGWFFEQMEKDTELH